MTAGQMSYERWYTHEGERVMLDHLWNQRLGDGGELAGGTVIVRAASGRTKTLPRDATVKPVRERGEKVEVQTEGEGEG